MNDVMMTLVSGERADDERYLGKFALECEFLNGLLDKHSIRARDIRRRYALPEALKLE